MGKKINQVERNVINKLKLIQEAQKHSTGPLNTLQSSHSKGTPLKNSTIKDTDPQVKQLKARITNLEKSYEFSKQKITVLEEQARQKDAEIQKQSDDITKLKNSK